MATIIQNLNSIITTKNELNSILQENGVDGGEIFSEYPQKFRSVIAGSGGGVSYSYLNEKLTYYVEKDELYNSSYATQSYVVDYVNTYVPTPDLSAYATKSYVADYVATYAPTPDLSAYVTKNELSAQSYATTSDLNGYLPITGGNLQGNLIPSQSASYNLGSSSSIWKEIRGKFVYTDTAYIGDINYITNTSNSGMIININRSNICSFLGGINIGISPASDKSASLGNPQQYWKSTYTSNIYAYNAYISNYSNFLWTGTSAEYAALSDYTTYQIYMIKEG